MTNRIVNDYNHMIQLNPDYAPACNRRQLTRLQLGDGKGAIADLNSAIELELIRLKPI